MDLSYLVVFAYCLAHVACARGCQGKSSSNASLETCARLGMRSNRNSNTSAVRYTLRMIPEVRAPSKLHECIEFLRPITSSFIWRSAKLLLSSKRPSSKIRSNPPRNFSAYLTAVSSLDFGTAVKEPSHS